MSPEQAKANAAELRAWAQAKKSWTLSEVADYVTECGSHFFARETMRFWGDTRANWRARMIHGRLYVERIKAGRGEAGKATRDKIGRLRPVDFERGCVGVELSESEQAELFAPPVPVLFRTDKRGEFKGTVTAVFPTLPGSPGMLTCYAHIGQHGSCSREWVSADTRPATPDEFAPLKAELERIGYRLRIVQRISPQMDSERRDAERRPYVESTYENRDAKRG